MYQPVQSDENFLEPFGPLLKSEAGQDWEDDSQPSLEQKRRFIRPSAMLIHISIASLYILVITGIMWFVGHYGERFRQPDPDIYCKLEVESFLLISSKLRFESTCRRSD
jgi:hypothetical protein